MMNCRQVARLYSDSLEYRLPLKDRIGIRFHVMLCRGCRNFGRQMKLLRELARVYTRG